MLRAPFPQNRVNAAWSQVSDGNVSDRFGPLEEVIANRREFLHQLGLRLDDCVRLAINQPQSDQIRVVGRDHAGIKMAGGNPDFYSDALITQEPGVALWLLVADCIPVMFYDPKTPRIALAHCGFGSTDLRLSPKVVGQLSQLGSRPADLKVVLGPGVRAESYVFDQAHKKTTGPEWEPYLIHPDATHIGYDNFAYNLAQITAAGVPRENITISDYDTGTSNQFFSHVRSWRTGEAEGRFAAVIALTQ